VTYVTTPLSPVITVVDIYEKRCCENGEANLLVHRCCGPSMLRLPLRAGYRSLALCHCRLLKLVCSILAHDAAAKQVSQGRMID